MLIGVLAALAVAVSIWAHLTSRFPGDLQLTLLLQSLDGQAWRSAMEGISFLFGGWRAMLLTVVISLMVWWRLGRLEGALVLAAGLTSFADSAFKVLVGRPRPASELVRVLADEHNNGFPSGHAFLAALLLGVLAYFAITRIRNRRLRLLSFTILIILILLVGISRVYLGVHWPSDVLGGYLFGCVFLALLVWSYETWEAHLGTGQPLASQD